LYPADEIVRHNGVLYLALSANQGHDPETSPEFWERIGEYTSIIEDKLAGAYAAIQDEKIVRTTENEEITRQLNQHYSSINANSAAIQNEADTRASQDSSISRTLSQVQARADDAHTAVGVERTARSNRDEQLARDITTVQASADTKIGQVQTAISQEQSSRISADGRIESHYTVNIDTSINNKYMVSGFSLLSEANSPNPRSEFLVRADRFAISTPYSSSPRKTPFAVLTSTDSDGNPPGVYMDSAMIRNLAVDTLRIKDGSVSTKAYKSFNGGWSYWGSGPDSGTTENPIYIGGSGTMSLVTYARLYMAYPGYIIAIATGCAGYPSGDGRTNFELEIDDTGVASCGGGNAFPGTSFAMMGVKEVSVGNHDADLNWNAATNVRLHDVEIVMLGIYR
jgi:hypothetical protein